MIAGIAHWTSLFAALANLHNSALVDCCAFRLTRWTKELAAVIAACLAKQLLKVISEVAQYFRQLIRLLLNIEGCSISFAKRCR